MECRGETETFWIKQGDTLPVIEAVLRDTYGNPVPLTGCDVAFHMRLKGETQTVVDEAAEIVDDGTPALRGRVRYEWQDGDTDFPGNFQAEWQVTAPGSPSKTMTFPNPGYTLVIIADQIA